MEKAMKDCRPPCFNRPRICRKLHFCPTCGKAYRRKIELDMHLLCHSLPPQSPENLWRFHLADLLARCPHCLKGFCRRQDLMCHMNKQGGCVKNGTASFVAAVDYKIPSSFQTVAMEATNPSSFQTVAMEATNCHGRLHWENGKQIKPLSEPGEPRKLKLPKCTTKFERQCAIVQRFLDAEKQRSKTACQTDTQLKPRKTIGDLRKRGKIKKTNTGMNEQVDSLVERLTKNGVEYFQCKYCLRVFNTKTNLSVHERIHN